MADKIVQLKDKDDNNIYPIASVPNGAKITMTDTDPGEGAPLEADNYIAVYGGNIIGNLWSGMTATAMTDMTRDTQYTADFDGFIWFEAFFTAVEGFCRYSIIDENNNLIIQWQQNAGPKADYRHNSPLFPMKRGWKWILTTDSTAFNRARYSKITIP